MNEETIIKISNVSKKYSLYAKPQDRFKEAIGIKRNAHNEFYALNDVSFDVKKGETVGIVGTNGSGKSTLLKIITGVLQQTEGNVQVSGKISALLELGAGFNQEYTGLENIYLNGRMMGYTKAEMSKRVDSIIEFAEIGEFIHQPVKTYSSGMFARLAFAVAINVDPDILIVDEALSVGDLFFQNKCFRKFDELKQKNVTILFVSHDISSVRQMCSRVLWIEKGQQIIFDQSDKVCDMYMDMKRVGMNELHIDNAEEDYKHLASKKIDEKRKFPAITCSENAIRTDKLEIVSFFVTDENSKKVGNICADKYYDFHVLVRLHENMEHLIVGMVLENRKGIPLYDMNNFISQGKVLKGKKGEVLEVVYGCELPRLMKDTYVVAAAVAQGSQENHVMLTWLHGIAEIEVVNPGYNSSYIEIPTKVTCNVYDGEDVTIE